MTLLIKDTYFMNQMFWVSRKLCLMPPLVGLKVNLTTTYKIYSLFISIYPSLTSLYALTYRLKSSGYQHINNTYLFLEILQEMSMVFTATVMTVTRIYFSKNAIEDFFDSMNIIDEYLIPDSKGFKGICRIFWLQHFLIFMVFSFNVTVWILIVGTYNFHFHIFKHLYYYQIAMNTALAYSFSSIIKNRFEIFHTQLKSKLNSFRFDQFENGLKMSNKTFMLLTKSICSFNSVFGSSLLTTFCFVIVDLLMNSSVLIDFFIFDSKNKIFFLENALMVLTRIAWMSLTLVSYFSIHIGI